MRYLKTFIQINETLRSDTIEVVVKKLNNFFDKLGFNNKELGVEVEYPNYQIIHDRIHMKSGIEKYKNPSNDDLKLAKEYNVSIPNMVKNMEKDLENFKYGDIFIFTSKNTPDITNRLLKLIDSIGYFVATANSDYEGDLDQRKITVDKIKYQNKISISIEPKYDSQVDFQEEYLYHTTSSKSYDKIMRIGLVPKTKNTRSFYPQRIYLSPNLNYNNSIKNQLGTDKSEKFITLKIKKFPGLKLYKDVRFKGGFYTYSNIPPKYIEVIA